MPLNYGTSGIRQRDYRVHAIFKTDASYENIVEVILSTFNNYRLGNYSNSLRNIKVLITDYYDPRLMTHIGELRKDSIDLSIADGDSIEGNEVGKIVLSKTGTFSAELINSTAANKVALAGYDGQEAIILLEEIDGRIENFFDAGAFLETHEIIVIGNYSAILAENYDGSGVMFSYSEKDTGGAVPTSTISLEKKIAKASDFRTIFDQSYESEVDDPIVQNDTVSGDKNLLVRWTDSAQTVDSYLVELALDDDFVDIVASQYVGPSKESFLFQGLTNGTTYYSRIRAVVNGYPKTKYSNIKSGTPTAP